MPNVAIELCRSNSIGSAYESPYSLEYRIVTAEEAERLLNRGQCADGTFWRLVRDHTGAVIDPIRYEGDKPMKWLVQPIPDPEPASDELRRFQEKLQEKMAAQQYAAQQAAIVPVVEPAPTAEPPTPPERPSRPVVMCYGYTRCSHVKSTQSGLGLKAQARSIRQHYKYLRQRAKHTRSRRFPRGFRLKWGGMFIDRTVSAYKKHLILRPAGYELHSAMRAGDHVIFARLDRAFRSMIDQANTLRLWEDDGRIIHFVDLQIDSSTAAGKMALNMMGAVNQCESDLKSERIRAAFAVKRRLGLPTRRNSRRVGYKAIGLKAASRWIVDIQSEAIGRYIALLRNHRRHPFDVISDILEGILAKRENRAPVPRYGYGFGPNARYRKWSKSDCWKAYQQVMSRRKKSG